MKYINKVEINLPMSEVVELWKDENNFAEWQDGFIRIDHISGEPGEESSQSEIYLMYNNREMKLLQTVLKSDLPGERIVLVEHEDMTNTMANRFRELDDNRTEYLAEIEYTKFNGLMPKLMAKLLPGMFKKQSQKWLDQFKRYAENRAFTIKP